MRRVRESVANGLTAEAAVHRAANELRDRMRRIADPYLRERLADMEDLAGRLLAALDGEEALPAIPQWRHPVCPPARPPRSCWSGTPAASAVSRSRRAARLGTPRSSPARSACRALGGVRGLLAASRGGRRGGAGRR